MSILRFASICLLGVAGIGTVSAQSAATPVAPSVSPLHIPAYTDVPALLTGQLEVPKLHLQILKTSLPQVRMAHNDSPCYTLRSYGFTDQDLQSADPRPSATTTCTPAASGQMKQTISIPAKLKR